jgi:hypothetical protein
LRTRSARDGCAAFSAFECIALRHLCISNTQELAVARGSGVMAANYPFRAVSLIAVDSTGQRPLLPQPVPLVTDVVEHSLGAAELRGDPRPIAATLCFHNELPIDEADRTYRWPLGPRPDGHPALSELGL